MFVLLFVYVFCGGLLGSVAFFVWVGFVLGVGCVFGGWRDCPGLQMAAGCGGRYGLSLSNLQPPSCPPRCPTELPRGSSVMLSGLVGQALAIGITRVGGALVFLIWGAAFFLLDAPSRCAGTVVLGAWMAWTSRPAPPDGLSWCLDDPTLHDPASNPGVTNCAIAALVPQTFSLWCIFGDAQRPALAIRVLYTPPGGLLLWASWHSLLGAS